MYEVEIKVPARVADVRERLRAAGAERTDARRQRDVYYDAPHRDFARTDEALRVRHETPLSDGIGSPEAAGGTTKITYKGPLLDAGSKSREEHETTVDDADAAAGIFDGLGFEPAAEVTKRREFWAFEGFTVTLDAVDELGDGEEGETTEAGEFVEIEREVDEEAAIPEAREAAGDALDRLGLDADDQIRTSYLGLVLAERADA
ncbi:class IV adenylate cyclase [Halorubrum gandharaense]